MTRRKSIESTERAERQSFTPYTLWVVLVTSLAWPLQAFPAMSPAFVDPTGLRGDCDGHSVANCTGMNFRIVPQDLHFDSHNAEWTTAIYFVGSLCLGQIPMLFADSIGRRPVLLASTVLTALSSLICALAQSFPIFLFGRFLQGACFTSSGNANWLLCSESIPLALHGRAMIFFSMSWVAGYCALAPLALWTGGWRLLYSTVTVMALLYAALLYLTTRESVGFLLARGRIQEACAWRDHAIAFNAVVTRGKSMETQQSSCEMSLLEQQPADAQPVENGGVAFLAGKALRNSSVVCHLLTFIYIWTTDYAVYNGLSLTSTSIEVGDPLINYLLSGIVELPGAILLPLFMDLSGRRPTVAGSHLITAAALCATPFISQEWKTAYLFLWMAAKLGAGASFFALYIYASEVFPVEYRSLCMGTAATIGNLGAIAAPYFLYLNTIRPWMCTVAFGVLSAVSVLLVRLLPETLHGH